MYVFVLISRMVHSSIFNNFKVHFKCNFNLKKTQKKQKQQFEFYWKKKYNIWCSGVSDYTGDGMETGGGREPEKNEDDDGD